MTDITATTNGNLIASEHVTGTNVYNTKGEKLGHVEDIMIDKVSGQTIYAVMSFGGFLGMGAKQHPLPWSTLKYDKRQDGYVVNLDKKVLEAAPTFEGDDFIWTAEYGRRVDKHYNVTPYWL